MRPGCRAPLCALLLCGVLLWGGASARQSAKAAEKADKPQPPQTQATAERPADKLPITPRHPPPPSTDQANYCGALCFDSRYVNWVRDNVRPLVYDMDDRVLQRRWEPFTVGSNVELDPADIVVVTQTGPSRLPYLVRMMALWGGPVSAALFIPFPKTDPRAAECLAKIVAYVTPHAEKHPAGIAFSALYALEESPGNGCNVFEAMTGNEQTQFNYELWNSRYKPNGNYIDIWDGEYPINALRNLAKRQIETNAFMFLIDSDLSITAGAYQDLRHGDMRPRIMSMRKAWEEKGERKLLVVPAFERTFERQLTHAERGSACKENLPTCWVYESYDIPLVKAKVMELAHEGALTAFYWSRYAKAHRCYDPMRWLSDKDSEPYTVPYQGGCEPYTVVVKDASTPYDERYRGRDFDKISQLQEMALRGAEFVVDHRHFLVHVPHAQTMYVDTLIDWHPASKDQGCLATVLLHIHADEVNKNINAKHHYSRIATSQLMFMHNAEDIVDRVVPHKA